MLCHCKQAVLSRHPAAVCPDCRVCWACCVCSWWPTRDETEAKAVQDSVVALAALAGSRQARRSLTLRQAKKLGLVDSQGRILVRKGGAQ